MNASFRSHRLAVVLLAGLMAASLGSARPGMYEYWKSGTKRKGSRTLPRESRTSHATSAAAPSTSSRPPQGPRPWSEDWFSDPKLVREHLREMAETIRLPMIGEGYPLPRGGGFACTPVDEPAISPNAKRLLECTGPELGGDRWNEFYAPAPDEPPTLERVRWRIVAPPPAPLDRWRAVVVALRDSLAGSIGAPSWTSADSLSIRWDQDGYRTSVRLYATPSRADSLEITCVSNRLPEA